MTLELEPGARSADPKPVTGLEPGAHLSSRYRLDHEIGRGRNGSVWLGRDTLLERPVAIRLPDCAPDAPRSHLSRFTQEARAAAGLWHPNLVQIFDFGLRDGLPFLIMEYLGEGTLEDRFRSGAMSCQELRRLACDLLSALAFLHRQNRVHGSVRATAVLLDEAGRPHLTGVGRVPTTTAPGSPEEDLFALGTLLAQAPCPLDRDPALAELVGALLAPESGRQFNTAEGALEALQICGDPSGQETQELDVLAMLDEEPDPVHQTGPVAGDLIAEDWKRPRWAPRRVLTAIGLYPA